MQDYRSINFFKSTKEEVVCEYVVENINLVSLANISKTKYTDRRGKANDC